MKQAFASWRLGENEKLPNYCVKKTNKNESDKIIK